MTHISCPGNGKTTFSALTKGPIGQTFEGAGRAARRRGPGSPAHLHPVDDQVGPIQAHHASKLRISIRMLLQEEVLDAVLSIPSVLADNMERVHAARRDGTDRHKKGISRGYSVSLSINNLVKLHWQNHQTKISFFSFFYV